MSDLAVVGLDEVLPTTLLQGASALRERNSLGALGHFDEGFSFFSGHFSPEVSDNLGAFSKGGQSGDFGAVVGLLDEAAVGGDLGVLGGLDDLDLLAHGKDEAVTEHHVFKKISFF